MSDTKLYANSYIDPSDNQRRFYKDLEATHEADASDPSTVLGGIKSTADNAETIAMGATRAMVFDTIAAMETWLKDAANKGKLKIGDNLYIKAVDVPDYWVSAVYETATPEGFYYNYSRLEVGTIKLSNVVTTDASESTSMDRLFGKKGSTSMLITPSNLAAQLSPLFPASLFVRGERAKTDMKQVTMGANFSRYVKLVTIPCDRGYCTGFINIFQFYNASWASRPAGTFYFLFQSYEASGDIVRNFIIKPIYCTYISKVHFYWLQENGDLYIYCDATSSQAAAQIISYLEYYNMISICNNEVVSALPEGVTEITIQS